MEKDTAEQDTAAINTTLLRKLVRQLRFLNFMIVFFGLISVVGAVVFGLLAWKAVDAIVSAPNSITNILNPTASSSDDTKKQLCAGTGSVATYLKQNTEICK